VTVFLGHGPEKLFCTSESVATTSVYLEPMTPPLLQRAGEKATVVNGIGTYSSFGGPSMLDWQVPSLGIEILAYGPLARRVLSTLTYSPRAVAFDVGPAPVVPRSWHEISFGGIRVAVPPSWTVDRRSAWGTCSADGIDVTADQVLLDNGKSLLPLRCPRVVTLDVVQAEINGLTIDPGAYGPLPNVGSYGPCERVNQLRVCPSATENMLTTLVLAVYLRDHSAPVAVEIGTSANGITARTILWSMRAS
jgi:hypothetical protein